MPSGEKGTSRPYLRGRIWWIRYRVSGDPKERCESSKSQNKEVAKRLLRQRLKEIDDSIVTAADATIADLLKLYLNDQRRQGRGSFHDAERNVQKHLLPAFGSIKAATLTTAQIERFIDQKQAAEYSNASINRYLSSLKRGFTLGMESLPPLVLRCPKIKKLEEDNVREGFFEHEQYLVLRSALATHQQIVLVIGYHFGMRRGEILQLRWDQVDWDANLIRLEKRQTKSKQARVAPFYGELRAWLEYAYNTRDPECPFIVNFRGERIGDLKTGWKSATERAGLAGFHIHDLRRTAIRNMTRAGIPEKRAMLISGHRTRSVFDRYDIIDERDMQSDGEKYAEYMEQKEARAKARTRKHTVTPEGVSSESANIILVQ